MRITVNRESDVPIREQLAAQLVFLIGSGQLKPTDQLPSVRELAQRLHVHRNTVSEAYADPALDALVERIPGRRLTVRANGIAGRGHPELDAVIDSAIAMARQSGYTAQELRRRVQERLRAEPPDHVLLVEGEAGMGMILRVELRERLTCGIDTCTVRELEADRDRAQGALVLCPPGLLPDVDPLVPAERAARRIVYAPADAHLDRIRQLTEPSLILVASVSRYFAGLARSVLAPALGTRHALEEYVMAGDRQPPGRADLTLCDSVTVRLLRARCPSSAVIHHRLISSTCLEAVGEALKPAPPTPGG